jgi:hypothetical protein
MCGAACDTRTRPPQVRAAMDQLRSDVAQDLAGLRGRVTEALEGVEAVRTSAQSCARAVDAVMGDVTGAAALCRGAAHARSEEPNVAAERQRDAQGEALVVGDARQGVIQVLRGASGVADAGETRAGRGGGRQGDDEGGAGERVGAGEGEGGGGAGGGGREGGAEARGGAMVEDEIASLVMQLNREKVSAC